jgi:hypothetical protein
MIFLSFASQEGGITGVYHPIPLWRQDFKVSCLLISASVDHKVYRFQRQGWQSYVHQWLEFSGFSDYCLRSTWCGFPVFSFYHPVRIEQCRLSHDYPCLSDSKWYNVIDIWRGRKSAVGKSSTTSQLFL